MSISLFDHNQKAFDAAMSMLKETGKAAIIHPTGTGKSFIGFKLCEEYPDKRICWLSPSSYIFKTQLESLKAASDGYSPENIIFFTYAKLNLLREGELLEINPDYIVLDEFHRCGASSWGVSVKKLLDTYPQAPVLGLSATNIRYLDGQRDMAVELFDGCIASEMTLGDAVVRGILSPPKYVLSVYSYQKDLEKYRTRISKVKSKEVRDKADAYLEDLRRSLENAEGLDEIFFKHIPDKAGKYILFCAGLEHMQQMKEKTAEWFGRVDAKPYIYSVYSEDPGAEKDFAKFKENNDPHHLKLLFCIDALNEGVHVKDISGVVLLRPTVSPIIYKQQIGRAMAANADHPVVIFDIVMNIDNLYSISVVKQEIENTMDYLLSSGEGERIVNDSFEIFDEIQNCRILFEKLNDVLSASWDLMFEHAKAYYEERGNLEVPKKYRTKDGYCLGQWLQTQRKVYKGLSLGVLTETQKNKLESIGMRWETHWDSRWEVNYAAAKRYFEEHGNLACKVSYVTPEGIGLGRWLSNMRSATLGKKCRGLSNEKKDKLDSIGMIWDMREYQWEEAFSEAQDYYLQHKNLNVASGYITESGFRLGVWINNVRTSYSKNSLSAEKIKRLEAIGMSWMSRYDNNWLAFYEEAKAFYEEHGHLQVPVDYSTKDDLKLGRWVSRQYCEYQKGALDGKKISMLSEIGMIWDKTKPWEKRYALARQYFSEHGDINISQNTVVDGVWLGKWLKEQRKKKAKLTAQQIMKLEEIGMRW